MSSSSSWIGSATFWLVVGFAGQAIFTARFLVQWIASERKRDSVVPTAFWWLSIFGGFTLLSYAIWRQDPVIIAGQSMGVFIYARNLMLVSKRARRARKEETRAAASAGGGGGSSSATAVPRPHVGMEPKAAAVESRVSAS